MEISNQLKNFEDELRRKGYRENSIKNYISYCSVFLEKYKYKDSPKHISSTLINRVYNPLQAT